MGNWQDISTAPRDGTKVDLWVVFGTGPRRVPDAYFSARGQEWVLGKWHAGQYEIYPHATHWMPIPAPPSDPRS